MNAPWRRRDVVELLSAHHESVRAVFDHLLSTSDERKQEVLFASLDKSLRILATIEEEVFYQGFKLASATNEHRRMYLEAREQHRAIGLLLDELRLVPLGTETFWAKAKVLRGLLVQHAEHEERETFRTARSIVPEEELRGLAKELRKRRWELKSEKKGDGEETPAAGAAGDWSAR